MVIDLGPSRGGICPTKHVDRDGDPVAKAAHRWQVGDKVVLACLGCAKSRWPDLFR